MVVYMDIRNWGRNKVEINPAATEVSLDLPVNMKMAINPIRTAFATP